MSALAPCRSCRSWTPIKDRSTGAAIIGDNGISQGECHRYPPNTHIIHSNTGIQVRSQFPITHAEMYCDEYSAAGMRPVAS